MTADNKAIRTDNPIAKKEADTLGRGGFSEKIGKAISQYDGLDSLVIGIYGRWGTGKTSVINMVLETVAAEAPTEESAPIIINFRPWYFSGQDHLLEQFFKQMAIQIQGILAKAGGTVSETGKQIGNALTKFSKVLRPAKYFAPVIGIPGELIEKALNTVGEVGDSLTVAKGEEVFDPNAVKEEIADKLKELNRKVIIVIDDIDRLTKTEIRQIFQLVKALADFPNTVYLLSFDKDIVCEALTDVQTGNANKYLEKIIQVPFELPSIPPKSLHLHLTSNLDKIIGEDFNETLQAYWSSVYIHALKRYFTNIREINRFLNLFQFEYSLLRNEVNIVDLIALTAIKSQDSKLYHFIHHNKEIFNGSSSDPEDMSAMARRIMDKGEYKEFLKNSYMTARDDFDKIEIIEPTLKEIFPYFNKLLSTHSFESDGNYKELKKSQRIADPEHFDRVFYLSVPEGQIPYTKLKEIIALQDSPANFATAIGAYSYDDKCTLIELFRIHLSEFKDENLITTAKAVAPIAENEDENSDYKRFEFSLSKEIRFFISDLFKKDNSPVDTQLERYKELFADNAIGPYMQSELLYTIAHEIGAYSQNGHIMRDTIEKGEFKDRFFALEDVMLAKLKTLAESGELQKHHKMTYLLYTWSRAKPDEPKAYVQKLLDTDDGVVDFVTSLLSYSYGSNGRTPNVHKRYVDDFTDESELITKVRAIKEKSSYYSLSDKSKEAIEALLWRIDNPDKYRDL